VPNALYRHSSLILNRWLSCISPGQLELTGCIFCNDRPRRNRNRPKTRKLLDDRAQECPQTMLEIVRNGRTPKSGIRTPPDTARLLLARIYKNYRDKNSSRVTATKAAIAADLSRIGGHGKNWSRCYVHNVMAGNLEASPQFAAAIEKLYRWTITPSRKRIRHRVDLDPATNAALTRLAQQVGVSKSEFVRRMIRALEANDE